MCVVLCLRCLFVVCVWLCCVVVVVCCCVMLRCVSCSVLCCCVCCGRVWVGVVCVCVVVVFVFVFVGGVVVGSFGFVFVVFGVWCCVRVVLFVFRVSVLF